MTTDPTGIPPAPAIEHAHARAVVLDELQAAGGPLDPAEIADRTDLPHPTVVAILRELASAPAGLVEPVGRGTWRAMTDDDVKN